MSWKEVSEKYWAAFSQKNLILYGAGATSRTVVKILRKKGIMPKEMVDTKRYGEPYDCEDFHTTIRKYDEIRKMYPDYCILMTVAIEHALSIRRFLEEQGETHPIYHMMCPFKVDDEVLEDMEGLEELADCFSDDCSRKIYEKYIRYKITGDMEPLLSETNGSGFFDRELIKKRDGHRFVDVGAYTGDTIAQFLVFCDGGYEKIWGMEADPGNYKKAEAFQRLSRLENLKILNIGGWSSYKTMKFHTLVDDNAAGFDSPNLYVDVDMDMRFEHVGEKGQTAAVEVVCDTLDHLFEKEHPTLIKINALAADQEILIGAENILQEDKPVITMDYGARPAYVKNTIQFLHKVQPKYKLYLREKAIFNDYKTLLYAIPG